ncbi:hypothetical protein DYB28_014966 [Aphanomyces astaci]|uniref:Chromo domain-containing protein n=1 Tax=Aphanomyces astaci TaxID=112090 RepID=A0A9X8HEU4_APHAT|nr:hypothetical protein DYB28_014966 [Aphanomyces astaci]
MHRDVAARSEKLRQQARGRREKKAHVRLAKFALGDFVLLGKIIKFPNKLALNWKGPYRVSRVDSDYVMEVQQLVNPFTTSEVFHADGKFEVRVNWKGLDEEGASWVPALQLYEDIAVVLRCWIVKNASDGVVKEMRDDLEATLGHSL